MNKNEAMNQNFGIYTDLYNSVINDLESGKFLPNLKAIRKQIADAKKTIRVLVKGAAFCQNMEMLAKTERRIQLAKQRRDAMVAIMEYINEKMRYKKNNEDRIRFGEIQRNDDFANGKDESK